MERECKYKTVDSWILKGVKYRFTEILTYDPFTFHFV